MAKTREDVEHQLAIAKARRRRIALEGNRSETVEGLEDVAAGTSRGVANILGTPVDLTNAMLSLVGQDHPEPFGGSRSIQRGFHKLGLGAHPDEDLGRGGRVGEVIGTAAAVSPAIVATGARAIAQGLTQVFRQPKILSGFAQDVARSATRNPVTFVAAETTAAVGAGLASYEALQRWPDDPTAIALSEIAGGITPFATIAAVRGVTKAVGFVAEKLPLAGAVIRHVRDLITNLRPQTATSRARARVDRATPNRDTTLAERLDRTDIIDESGLTAQQRIGDPELLALERSVMEQDAALSFQRQQQLAGVNQNIRASLLVSPADDVPTHQVKLYFSALLDERIKQAALLVDEKLAKIGPTATREDLNTLARQELNAAKTAARTQETDLYTAIPERARVPTEAAQETYQTIKLNTPRAQQEDIPARAKKFLEPTVPGKKGPVKNPNYFGEETDVSEMRGLASKLREDGRRARADNRFNEARIADDIANSIYDDIGNAIGDDEVKKSVDIAVAFSKDLNDRFTRGPVGRVLGSDTTGTQNVSPGLTLEATVGRRGPRSREATDALLTAVERHGSTQVMRDHIESFLMDDFRRAAVSEGVIDQGAAARWMNQNQDVLARFPELRRELTGSRQAGARLIEAERLVDPRVSRAAVFIDAPPGDEIQRVLSTGRPRQAMKELVVLARQDPTGEAEKGLKTSFFEFLLKRAEVPAKLDASEAPFISGRRLTDTMNEDTVLEGMRGLFTKTEVARLNKIRQTALLLDNARMSPTSAEGIIGDEPAILFQLLARMGGAQAGRVIAGHTGGGTVQTPGILAAQAKRIIDSGVRDPASRMLTDAVLDEKLFRTLLLPPGNETFVRTRLNAWVADVLREQQAMPDEE